MLLAVSCHHEAGMLDTDCAPEGGKPCCCGFLEHLSFADHPCQVGLLSSFVSTEEGLECQGASGADALRSAVQQPLT